MAQAYTPGLKRKEFYVLRKTRMLPGFGEIVVKVDDRVTADQIVGKTHLLGNVQVINIAFIVGCEPEDVPKIMLKKIGDPIKKGELILHKKSWFSFLEKKYFAEIDGTLEHITVASGSIIIREPPIPLELDAYLPGEIVDVVPKQSVTIECKATYIQGIFGVGGESHGDLLVVTETSQDILSADLITEACRGKVLVGGAIVTSEALKKAIEIGVKGIVVGGIENQDLSDLLGFEIGVAITGREDIGLTLIVTEGFGSLAMAEKTFQLLKKFEGNAVAINGATQIRAGVMRPEVIIPLPEDISERSFDESEGSELLEGMVPGTPIRMIREPYFGLLGQVVSLPVKLQQLESESMVRVLEAELETGQRVIIPRANVEIIEE